MADTLDFDVAALLVFVVDSASPCCEMLGAVFPGQKQGWGVEIKCR
jgi:hypothetical protein